MLKSKIVPIVPLCLKTPPECLPANTFPHGKRTICLGVFTIRHQKFTVRNKENSLKPAEKTPKPTVWTSLRTVSPLWGTILTKNDRRKAQSPLRSSLIQRYDFISTSPNPKC